MTFKDKTIQELRSCGLSEEDIEAVCHTAMQEFLEFKGRWNEDETAYPPVMWELVWMNVKVYALAYCEEHFPEAWFKPVFYSTEKQIELGIIKE